MSIKGVLTAIQHTKTGLATQMKKLELVSENIANADRGPDAAGNVYKRKSLQVFQDNDNGFSGLMDQLRLQMRRSDSSHMSNPARQLIPIEKAEVPEFEVVESDQVQLVYDPLHPQANADGYVVMPAINLIEEMVDLIAASRSYEANVTVINAAKQMAKKTLEL